MNPVAVVATLLAVAAGPDTEFDQFRQENLPAGCQVERIDGPALRLKVPAGKRKEVCNPEDANIDGLPWVARRVEGDFEIVFRVRLKLPADPVAAGITRFVSDDDGTRVESIPAAAGGLHLTAGGRAYATAIAQYERKGQAQVVQAKFGLSSADRGIGGSVGGVSDPAAATWLAVRRRGGAFERRGGPEVNGQPNWCTWMKDEFPLPEVLDLRLFATGNLNKPFAVEFDQLAITSLPAAKK